MKKWQSIFGVALLALVGGVARPAAAANLCTLTGNLYDIIGAAAVNARVYFKTVSTQSYGGTIIAPSSFSVVTDSSGNLPTSPAVTVPEGAIVLITVASGQPVQVQIPLAASADLSTLILANSDPPSVVSAIACNSGGDFACSTTNPGTGAIGTTTLQPGKVTQLQGTAISSTLPSDAELLQYRSSGTQWTPFSLSQDVTLANSGAATVNGSSAATFTAKNIAANSSGGPYSLSGFSGALEGMLNAAAYGLKSNVTSAAISSISGATLTIAAAGNFANGDNVAIPFAGPVNALGYPGAPTLAYYSYLSSSGSADTTYCYEVTDVDANMGESAPSPANCIGDMPASLSGAYNIVAHWAPVGSAQFYRVYGCDAGNTGASIASSGTPGASESGATVTITTTAAHGFSLGQVVYVTGVSVSGYNGTYKITAVTSTTFQYTDINTGLANSGGGTAFACSPEFAGLASTASVVSGSVYWSDFGYYGQGGQGTGYDHPSGIAPPVGPMPDTLFTTIASGAGTTSVTLASQPSVSGTVSLYLEPDAYTPLQAAINAANLSTNQAPVWIPPGKYVIAHPLSIGYAVGLHGACTSPQPGLEYPGTIVQWGGQDMAYMLDARDVVGTQDDCLELNATHDYTGSTVTQGMTGMWLENDGSIYVCSGAVFDHFYIEAAHIGLMGGGTFGSGTTTYPNTTICGAQFNDSFIANNAAPASTTYFGIILQGGDTDHMRFVNDSVDVGGVNFEQWGSGQGTDQLINWVGGTENPDSVDVDLDGFSGIYINGFEDEGGLCCFQGAGDGCSGSQTTYSIWDRAIGGFATSTISNATLNESVSIDGNDQVFSYGNGGQNSAVCSVHRVGSDATLYSINDNIESYGTGGWSYGSGASPANIPVQLGRDATNGGPIRTLGSGNLSLQNGIDTDPAFSLDVTPSQSADLLDFNTCTAYTAAGACTGQTTIAKVDPKGNFYPGTVGAWTPTLFGTTTAGTPTYNADDTVGSYEQIGRQVTVRFQVVVTALGGMAGDVEIGGLPVTSANVNQDNGQCFLTVANGVANDSGYTTTTGLVGVNSAAISLYEIGSGKALQALPVGDLTATVQFDGFCSYRAS